VSPFRTDDWDVEQVPVKWYWRLDSGCGILDARCGLKFGVWSR